MGERSSGVSEHGHPSTRVISSTRTTHVLSCHSQRLTTLGVITFAASLPVQKSPPAHACCSTTIRNQQSPAAVRTRLLIDRSDHPNTRSPTGMALAATAALSNVLSSHARWAASAAARSDSEDMLARLGNGPC